MRITTRLGGVVLLAAALGSMLARPQDDLQREAEMLAAFVATKFKITDMADAVLAGYHDAIARKAHPRPAAVQSLVRS